MKPSISVIVPCYNYGHFLAQTLQSVLGQSFHEWECIVIDDGSTDDTRDIANSFVKLDNRFEYIYQQNKGLSNARNKGLSISNGKYIQLLDADDLLESEKLEIQYKEILNRSKIIVFGHFKYFIQSKNNESQFRAWSVNQNFKSGLQSDFDVELTIRNRFPVSAPLFQRRLFEEIGGFDEDLTSLEDWDYWLRAAMAGYEFSFCKAEKDAYSLIRSHPKSMSQNFYRMQYNELIMREKVRKHLSLEFKKINDLGIESSLKDLLYHLSTLLTLKERREKLNEISLIVDLSWRFRVLKRIMVITPRRFLNRIIWILFESSKFKGLMM